MIHWLVLTGGASSRFGRDKAAAQLGESSLIERALDAVAAVDPASPVTVVGPDRTGGPAAAVLSMLPEIDADYVGVLAVDMPFAKDAIAAVVDACLQQAHDDRVEAWVPQDLGGRSQWLCAVYRRDALVGASRSSADWNGGAFHRLVGDLVTSVVAIESTVSLLDIDTPEDFQRALGIAEESSGDHQT